MMAGAHETRPAKIPVTVVGGFLGAGKTTYLNHLLRSGASRCAVLVNDFGAVNIDASLIARHDGATMTLTNGCVCCSIGGGFIETLGAILDERSLFDHIIIEASGVGDPQRIAEIALIEPSLRLNTVIVVADAARIQHLLVDRRVGDTVHRQFEHCDLVLLNKIDLVDDETRRDAHAAIAALRDGIRIIETSEQTMPGLPQGEERPLSRFRAEQITEIADHEGAFKRWSYRRTGRFDRTLLQQALADLPPSLLRLKGLCRLAGEREASVLQMVTPDWSLIHAETEFPDAGPEDIVLVGVGTADLPDTGELDAILDRALASAATPALPSRSILDSGDSEPPAQSLPGL
jgi:G3E family GTPase